MLKIMARLKKNICAFISKTTGLALSRNMQRKYSPCSTACLIHTLLRERELAWRFAKKLLKCTMAIFLRAAKWTKVLRLLYHFHLSKHPRKLILKKCNKCRLAEQPSFIHLHPSNKKLGQNKFFYF